MRKLDIFTHIWPKKFHEALLKTTGQMKDMHRRSEAVPMMTNLDRRFEVMDMFEGYQQVLSLASPPPDAAGDKAAWRDLSRIGSDGMSELCQKYPDRFPSFIASVAMRDPEGAVEEARRAVKELGACGIQIYSNVAGKAPAAPESRPGFPESFFRKCPTSCRISKSLSITPGVWFRFSTAVWAPAGTSSVHALRTW